MTHSAKCAHLLKRRIDVDGIENEVVLKCAEIASSEIIDCSTQECIELAKEYKIIVCLIWFEKKFLYISNFCNLAIYNWIIASKHTLIRIK